MTETTHPDMGMLCFYNILKRADLTLEDDVTLLRSYDPQDRTPAVTMHNGSAGAEKDHIYYRKGPLNIDHPYYDPEHPKINYIKERILRTSVPGAISLHIWGNDLVQKDSLTWQVRQALRKIFMADYTQCKNFDDGNCKTTGTTCDAIGTVSRICPFSDVTDVLDVNYRGPGDAFSETNVHDIEINSPTNLDELGVVPEVYHNSILITYIRDEEYVVGTELYCAYIDELDENLDDEVQQR